MDRLKSKRIIKEHIVFPNNVAAYLKDVLEFAKDGLPITVICPNKDYLKRCKDHIQNKRGRKLIDFELQK